MDHALSLVEINEKYKDIGPNTISAHILQILEKESINREIRNTMMKNVTIEEFETNVQWYTDIIWEYLSTLTQAQVKKYTVDDIEIDKVNAKHKSIQPSFFAIIEEDYASEIGLTGKNALQGYSFDKNYKSNTIKSDTRTQYIRKVLEANLAEIQYSLINELDLAIYKRLKEGYSLDALAIAPGIDIIGKPIPSAKNVAGLRIKK